MKRLLVAMTVGITALSFGCSYDLGSDCGPSPEATSSRIELERDADGEGTVGETLWLRVRYFVEWEAGEVNPQNMGESCVESEEHEEMVDAFDITEVGCFDDACEVVRVGEMLYQQMREIRVLVKKPAATLYIRVARSPEQFRPEVPEAYGEWVLDAEP